MIKTTIGFIISMAALTMCIVSQFLKGRKKSDA